MKKILLGLIIASFLLYGCTAETTGNTVDSVSLEGLQVAELQIEGMYCSSCATGVEYELKQVDGVVDATVNYKTGKCSVSYDPSKTDAASIARASTVYKATVVSDNV